jgi:feruloyl esterase
MSWCPIAPPLPVVLPANVFAQKTCENLKDLNLPNVTISSAVLVPEGPVTGVPGFSSPNTITPEHCAVQAIARPTSDSEIHFEVWLAIEKWNRKYEQWGNGGWAGSIMTAYLADAVRRGYVGAATDDGHKGIATDASWAIGHPEKTIDFAYRAVHLTSIYAHAIMQAFYSKHSPMMQRALHAQFLIYRSDKSANDLQQFRQHD